MSFTTATAVVASVTGSLSEFAEDVTTKVGEVGVGAMIALENIVPPIPSEAILPLAGFQASRGLMNPVWAWVAATIGSLVGAWILYLIGAWLGYERLHDLAGQRWFIVLSRSDLERGERFFSRYGGPIVLLGRCVPLVRSAVSIPAGLDRMSPSRFTLFTVIGSGVWNAVFLAVGWNLGSRWDQVEGWMDPISKAVLVLVLLAVVFVTVRKLRGAQARRSAARTSALDPHDGRVGEGDVAYEEAGERHGRR